MLFYFFFANRIMASVMKRRGKKRYELSIVSHKVSNCVNLFFFFPLSICHSFSFFLKFIHLALL